MEGKESSGAFDNDVFFSYNIWSQKKNQKQKNPKETQKNVAVKMLIWV